MKAAKDGEDKIYHPTHKRHSRKNPTRLGMSEEHFKSPVAALAKAVECLEWNEGEFVASSQCLTHLGSHGFC